MLERALTQTGATLSVSTNVGGVVETFVHQIAGWQAYEVPSP